MQKKSEVLRARRAQQAHKHSLALHARTVTLLGATVVALTLSACGGGGSGTADAGPTPPPPPPVSPPPPPPPPTTTPLPPTPPSAAAPGQWGAGLAALRADGYGVVQGSAYVLGVDQCAPYIKVFNSCAGNNPTSPYIIVRPPSTSEYIDPAYGADFNSQTADGTPTNEIYRLGNNEAVLTVINMPPAAAYLGYQSYVIIRDASAYPAGGRHSVTPDPNRYAVFGSIGNAINQTLIAQQANVHFGDANATVAFLTTQNPNVETAVRNALRSVDGLDLRTVLTEPVGDFVKTGLDAPADEMYTILRYALPDPAISATSANGACSGQALRSNDTFPNAGELWRNTPQCNVWVYRISLPQAAAATFPTPAYTQKLAVPESRYSAALSELGSLLQGALNVPAGTIATATGMRTTVTYDNGVLSGQVGQQCIASGIDCVGDSQDTDAYRFLNIGTLQGSTVAYVAGVNHTDAAINNASYISLGIYDATILTGVSDLAQVNPDFTGFRSGSFATSAAAVLNALGLAGRASPALQALMPQLYIAAFSRQCPAALGTYCQTISESSIPTDHNIILSHRAYLRPGTTTGGNPDRMLTPLVIYPATSG